MAHNRLGPTGQFPRGKLRSDDEGELRFAVTADPKTKTIVLDFGKGVTWLGLPLSVARNLAEVLLARIKELE